jgi:hypothetical protein
VTRPRSVLLGPFVAVRSSYTYTTRNHPHGTSTRCLELECGNSLRRKGSVPVPRRASCAECAIKSWASEQGTNNG